MMAESAPPAAPRETGLRYLLVALVGLATASVVSEYSGLPSAKASWQVLLENFAFIPMQLGSMYAMLRASRRTALPARTRRALALFGWGFGLIALGSIVWSTLSVIGIPVRYVSWVDPIYFSFYPLATIGLLSLPRTPGSRLQWRAALSWVMVLVALGSMILLVLQLEQTQARYSQSLRTMIAISSVGQLATIIALSDAIERALRQPSILAHFLLFAGLACTAIGDLGYQVAYSAGYDGYNWNVPIAMLANILMLWSSIHFLEDAMPESAESAYPRSPFTALPIIAMSVLVLIIVWLTSTGRMAVTAPLVISLVILNALLVIRDHVASRTAAEALLSSSQRAATRRLDAVVRHSSDAIVLLDGSGHLLFASVPADLLFRRTLSGLEGQELLAQLPDHERDGWRAFLAGLRAQPGQSFTHTWRIEHDNGAERLIETVGQDLRDEVTVGGIVLNSRDVTERTMLEDRLRQAQKLEVAGRLAGGVAHDFNNVLTAVMAGTELAQLSLDPSHPAQQDLAGIEASAQRGAALTRRLLAFVRQEPVPAQRFDLHEMLRDLEPLLQRLAGDANHVMVNVDPDVGTIVVDRTELEHIIFNLVANARDAMGHGGGIIVDAAVDTRRGDEQGDFHMRPTAGRYARITVSDNGHGMTDEVQRRMFDPFFTQKSGGRGTGLGLIGVRPLVEGAGGGLQVSSTPSVGTRVTLWLPAAAPGETRSTSASTAPHPVPAMIAPHTVPGAPRGAAPTPADGKKGRILLVEDEISVREQLTRLLDALGYTAVPVASATNARQLLASDSTRFDAVVSDVMMPGETGLEFAEWIRRTHPALPILLISGHTGTALDRAARQSEEMGLLRKPFLATELDERLRGILAG